MCTNLVSRLVHFNSCILTYLSHRTDSNDTFQSQIRLVVRLDVVRNRGLSGKKCVKHRICVPQWRIWRTDSLDQAHSLRGTLPMLSRDYTEYAEVNINRLRSNRRSIHVGWWATRPRSIVHALSSWLSCSRTLTEGAFFSTRLAWRNTTHLQCHGCAECSVSSR